MVSFSYPDENIKGFCIAMHFLTIVKLESEMIDSQQ